MSKYFLVVRLLVLVGLFFLLAAIFWGMANREKTVAHDGQEIYEEYRRTKPAGYTSILLVALVVAGIFVIISSILYEYHRLRRGGAPGGHKEDTGERDVRPWP